MLPTSSIPFTTAIEESLNKLIQLSDQPTLRGKVEDGTGQVCCQTLIKNCVDQMIGSMTAAQAERYGAKPLHVSVAQESCKLLGLVLDSIAKRPQFEFSIAARTGLNFLAGKADRVSKGLRINRDLNALVPFAALLVSEFELKGVTIPQACYDDAQRVVANSPNDHTSPVPVLAMAS